MRASSAPCAQLGSCRVICAHTTDFAAAERHGTRKRHRARTNHSHTVSKAPECGYARSASGAHGTGLQSAHVVSSGRWHCGHTTRQVPSPSHVHHSTRSGATPSPTQSRLVVSAVMPGGADRRAVPGTRALVSPDGVATRLLPQQTGRATPLEITATAHCRVFKQHCNIEQ